MVVPCFEIREVFNWNCLYFLGGQGGFGWLSVVDTRRERV